MTDLPRPAENGGLPEVSADRRAAMLRLGLAVGVAYFAPTVLAIDRSARAQGPSCAKNPKNC
ncbi:hypothetical protein GCM10017083_03330 [Thalassobaculum fulvum]|uniref:Uncharacterized protein n=1 Tax=Thalassobaculum fulvum TaxID=1633335 RepID=A0A919CNZ2_9PROT|nr:hypothetical protein [Thalassobaculum fulvum]GHD40243.1 hypothetical protein GCM10017083_03330 [Thalassobaculum fulvum]